MGSTIYRVAADQLRQNDLDGWAWYYGMPEGLHGLTESDMLAYRHALYHGGYDEFCALLSDHGASATAEDVR